MAGAPEAPAGDASSGLPDGVSAFVARVLDQLALSAWLPAGLLTAAGTLLIEFRVMKSASIGKALDAIASDKLRLLILTLPVLILGTLITQAFSFEAIRMLEGYWRRRGLAGWLRTSLTKRQVRKKERLEQRRAETAKRAFAVARPRLLVSALLRWLKA